MENNTDGKTSRINKQECLFLVVLDAVARQTAGTSESWQMLDNPCPGGPSTFLHCESNASAHLDSIIHLLPGTSEPFAGA